MTATVSIPGVGQEAKPREFGPIARQMIVRYAGASGDFNPMHYDDELARSAGYPSVFAQGMLSAALLSTFATDWLGAENIRRYTVRFRSQVWPGDVLTCSGRVTEVAQTASGALVSVELDCRRQTGDMVVGATAEFLLNLANGDGRRVGPPSTD